MATLIDVVTTVFTPAAGDFIVQVTGGVATLERRNTSGAAWSRVGEITGNEAMSVANPVAGAEFRFVTLSGTPAVRADQ